jgi:hypothetical protein
MFDASGSSQYDLPGQGIAMHDIEVCLEDLAQTLAIHSQSDYTHGVQLASIETSPNDCVVASNLAPKTQGSDDFGRDQVTRVATGIENGLELKGIYCCGGVPDMDDSLE